MQFITMAQEVRKRVGLQGTGPSSVDATGAEGLMISLVKDTWNDIQNKREQWKWMRSSKTSNLSVGVTEYTPLTIFGPNNRFKSWYKDTLYITKDSKKHWIPFMEYDAFIYKNINNITNNPVSEFTIRPYDYALIINPPDQMYVFEIGYKKSNQVLTLATDVPEMPSDYHDLIVYETVARYSLSIGMAHIYQEYTQKAEDLWGDLYREQNPKRLFKVRGIA